MKITLAGGTGFLGRPLRAALAASGHSVTVLTRDRTNWAASVDGADVVINLAGENIADGRWTAARKAVLRDSRIGTTRALVDAVRRANQKPTTFIGGSAVGYYGSTRDAFVDESSPPGQDFLAQLCVEWEAEAGKAEALGCRVVLIRSGVALDSSGGALEKMMTPFKLFVGGPIASGRQYFSWIHRDDWLRLVEWTVATSSVSGPVNATSPGPVTNEELSNAIGRALHRPSWLRAPAFALRLALGEMADVALINGQRVVPRRALEGGFEFRYSTIDEALQSG
jgi:uncharacterized protein (TIGR01777 family)